MCSSRYLIVHLECSSHCVYGHMRDVEQRSAFQVYGPRYDSFRVLYRTVATVNSLEDILRIREIDKHGKVASK